MEVIFITVFLTGVITAFLPCTFPVLLGYLGTIVGNGESKINPVTKTFAFFLGFTVVFSFFGAISGFLGTFSSSSLFFQVTAKEYLSIIGGVLLIIFGALLLRVIPMPGKLKALRSFKIPKWLNIDSVKGTFILGAIFAVGWSPCIGPVLGGILVLASNTSTVLSGTLLLAVFSLGISFPLFILSYFYGKIATGSKLVEKISPIASVVSGLIFISFGILFLTGNTYILSELSSSSWLYTLID